MVRRRIASDRVAPQPEESLVTRVGAYVGERTGGPVHLANFSTGGGSVATVLDQLRPPHADAVIVVAGSADALARLPLGRFRANVRELVECAGSTFSPPISPT